MRSSLEWLFHAPNGALLHSARVPVDAKPVMDAYSKTQQSTRSNTTVLYVGLAFTSEIAVYSASLAYYKTAVIRACYHSTFTCFGGGFEYEHDQRHICTATRTNGHRALDIWEPPIFGIVFSDVHGFRRLDQDLCLWLVTRDMPPLPLPLARRHLESLLGNRNVRRE